MQEKHGMKVKKKKKYIKKNLIEYPSVSLSRLIIRLQHCNICNLQQKINLYLVYINICN